MTNIMKVYWVFFTILGVFALFTWLFLLAASRKKAISKITRTEDLESTESYLLNFCSWYPISSFIKIIPGTFIGFGILGTFIGFAEGINGIPMNGTSDELFNGIGKLLAGMNNAFFTSIVGVICSITTSLFLFQFPLHKIKSELKKVTDEKLDSLKIENIEEKYNKVFEQSLQGYVAQINKLTESLIDAKESITKIPNDINAITKELENCISPIKDVFAEMKINMDSFSNQAKLMQDSSASIEGSLKELTNSSSRILQNVEAVNNSSADLNKRITEQNQKIEETNKKINDRFSKNNEEFIKIIEQYKLLDENIATVMEKLCENISAYSTTMQNTLVETLDKYTAAAEKVASSLLG